MSDLVINSNCWFFHAQAQFILFISEQLEQLQKVSLSKILCDNLDIPYIQENAFQLGDGL